MQNSTLKKSFRVAILSLLVAVLVVVAFIMFDFSSWQTVVY